MLQLIDNPRAVTKHYEEFHALLESIKIFPERHPDFVLSHMGGTAAIGINASPQLGIWTHPGSLLWNAFGLGNDPSMVVQINFQDYANRPQRRGSAFAIDETGKPVVVHRGHIGGGRPGIGRGLMLDQCRTDRAVLIETDGTKSECFVVGQLGSNLFPAQLANFVKEVHRVKQVVASPQTASLSGTADSLFNLADKGFIAETGTGKRTGGRVAFTHGLVVTGLAQRLQSVADQHGRRVRNDRHRDLMLTAGSEIRALFEIKTATNTQNVYTALGQLLLYSTDHPDATLIMVLPETLDSKVVKRLRTWQIEPLYYEFNGLKVVFKNLLILLKKLK